MVLDTVQGRATQRKERGNEGKEGGVRCLAHWGAGTRLGRGGLKPHCQSRDQTLILGFRDNRLTGTKVGFPILTAGRAPAKAMRCPRQRASPSQPEILSPTPNFRARQRKQLKRAKRREHMTTTTLW